MTNTCIIQYQQFAKYQHPADPIVHMAPTSMSNDYGYPVPYCTTPTINLASGFRQ